MKSLETPSEPLAYAIKEGCRSGVVLMASLWAHRQAAQQGESLTHQVHCYLGFHLKVLATAPLRGGSGAGERSSQQLQGRIEATETGLGK